LQTVHEEILLESTALPQRPCHILPTSKKYLEENDTALVNKIKDRLNENVVRSLILDEAPDMLDRPTLVTLFSFFDFTAEKPALVLEDLHFI